MLWTEQEAAFELEKKQKRKKTVVKCNDHLQTLHLFCEISGTFI